MRESFEDALRAERGDAAVLRRRGHIDQASVIENICDRFEAAAERFIRWRGEADAMLKSGHQRAWFRHRFPAWEERGLARWNPKKPRERQYLDMIVPQRLNVDAVRADAERTAQLDASSA